MKKFILTASLVFFTISTAHAQDGGWYLDIGGGLNLSQDQSGSNHRFRVSPYVVPLESGLALKAAVGRKISKNFRAEFEIAYRQNNFGSTFQVVNLALDGTGDVSATTLMANAIYVHTVSEKTNLLFGAGLGVAHLDIDFRRGASNPRFVLSRATDTRFAYQVKAGIEHEFFDEKKLFLEYNYLDTFGSDYNGFNSVGGANAPQKLDYSSHSVMAGIRIMF